MPCGYRRMSGTMSENVPQMLKSFELLSLEILRRHPFIAKYLKWGRINLSVWLAGSALRSRQFHTLARLLGFVAVSSPVFLSRLSQSVYFGEFPVSPTERCSKLDKRCEF